MPHRPGETMELDVSLSFLKAGEARRRVGLVPQTPADLLYLATVAAECAQADADAAQRAAAYQAYYEAMPLRRVTG